MGLLLIVNKNSQSSPIRVATVIAYSNVTYQPVRTPLAILITTRLREIKGRKITLEVFVKDGCDAKLAKAEVLWTQLNGPPRETIMSSLWCVRVLMRPTAKEKTEFWPL